MSIKPPKALFLLGFLAAGCASTTQRQPSAEYMRRFYCSNEGGGWTELYLMTPTKLTLGKSGAVYGAAGISTVKGQPATVFNSGHDKIALQTRMISGEHGGGMVQFGELEQNDIRGCAEED